MKSVLISIQPKWCEMILNGEKTIEVRKSQPNLKIPFKCYIYCTRGHLSYATKKGMICHNNGCGNVIGEFICDCITFYPWTELEGEMLYFISTEEGDATGMGYDEVVAYGSCRGIFLWRISALKVYDRPKELSEFSNPYSNRVKRPPQDWCYVEETGE